MCTLSVSHCGSVWELIEINLVFRKSVASLLTISGSAVLIFKTALFIFQQLCLSVVFPSQSYIVLVCVLCLFSQYNY